MPTAYSTDKMQPAGGDETVGLALGGGGARGLAHILVLEVFDELGLKPVMIAGTSIGAILGGAYATGLSAKEIGERADDLLSNPAEIARRLTSGDKKYMTNLRKRLRAGTAGPIENLLWLLAHGKPREQTSGDDVQVRILEVRAAAKKAIKESKSRFALPPGPVVEAEVVEKAGGNGGP